MGKLVMNRVHVEGSKVLDGIVAFFFLPEGKVLLKKLDDLLSIVEGFFIDVIDLLQ